MKRVLLAVALVLLVSMGALAADVTISGEVKYGFDKLEDQDAVWYDNPAFKLTLSNDNFELRLIGQEFVDTAAAREKLSKKWDGVADPDWDWALLNECELLNAALGHTHGYWDEWQDYDFTTKYGVLVERANVKLPVEGFGTFTAGRTAFETSDWDELGRIYDGLGWSGTFDKLTLKAMYAVPLPVTNDKSTTGLRGAYAFGIGGDTKLTVGGNYFQVEDEDEASYSADARLDFGESFDVYGEVGKKWNQVTAKETDLQYLCGEARVGGFELDLARDFEAEETEFSVEKTINNVLLHAGYIAPDDGDSKVACYAKYSF